MEVEYPDWQTEYRAALVESEPSRLATLIEAAESAMFSRVQALNSTSDGAAERQAIVVASRSLLAIKEKLLNFPKAHFPDGKKAPSGPEPD